MPRTTAPDQGECGSRDIKRYSCCPKSVEFLSQQHAVQEVIIIEGWLKATNKATTSFDATEKFWLAFNTKRICTIELPFNVVYFPDNKNR